VTDSVGRGLFNSTPAFPWGNTTPSNVEAATAAAAVHRAMGHCKDLHEPVLHAHCARTTQKALCTFPQDTLELTMLAAIALSLFLFACGYPFAKKN
jgi:hypothetical protein